jgi:two-component system response regulator AtoC
MLLRALIATRRPFLRRKLGRSIAAQESVVTEVTNRRELRRALRQSPYDIVLLERNLLSNGTALIDFVRSMPESPEVIVLSEVEDSEERAALMASGCLAVIHEGLGDKPLREALAALAARRRGDAKIALQAVPDEHYRLADYASKSGSMERFLKAARKIATRDSTVIILGETGVGKGLLARSIHNEGKRADFPFIAVNCGALTETLLESELFGHEKGAFTGATRARRGYFELAHRGTIFLDEIAELPLHLQTKLLKVLEDKTVQPLGSERAVHANVRIIAASNRDLEGEVREKRFRSDLYYRLNVLVLRVPPLRDRIEDIADLAQSYVEHFSSAIGREVTRVEDQALHALVAYSWPGNVRELINVIERAVLLCSDSKIQLEDLPAEIGVQPMVKAKAAGAIEMESDPDWLDLPWAKARDKVLAQVEQRYLEHRLREAGGQVGEAATRAGMAPRSLYEKMKSYRLCKEDFRARTSSPEKVRDRRIVPRS